MPIAAALGGIPIRLDQGRFTSSGEGDMSFDVTVTNVSASSVTQLFIVLEYLDARDESLGQISLVGAANYGNSDHNWQVHAEYLDTSFSTPLLPGETKLLHGIFTGVWAVCPSRARLTFLGVLFSNNTRRSWKAPNWKLNPILNFFSDDLTLKIDHPMNSPYYVRARATIDERGRIRQLNPLGDTIPAQTEALLSQLNEWRFFPAIREGQPIVSEMTIVFQFLPDGAMHIPIDVEPLGPPVLLVKAIPDESKPGRWRLFSGWRYGGSRLE